MEYDAQTAESIKTSIIKFLASVPAKNFISLTLDQEGELEEEVKILTLKLIGGKNSDNR
jgi:hypothetical protein